MNSDRLDFPRTNLGVAALGLSALLLFTGCAHAFRPYPLTEPMWVDEDRRPFGPRPDDYFSGFAWDGADQMLFRPMARFLAVDPAGESVNVNAIDEVPDSSWFHNRLSRRRLTTEEIIQAACTEAPLDPAGPWTIVSAKPNGANPGFVIEDAQGRRFLLKFDTVNSQPERATSADVIGSIFNWASGYHAPCNRIVFFERDILRIDEEATIEVGEEGEVPLTFEHLAPAFAKAMHIEDGRLRGAASQFLPGRPLGPWRYEGTRSDDPNDVIDHEDRRELRGGYVLAAWLNHFDTREQNTLAVWRDMDGTNGYIEHYYIDFGDTLGSLWAQEGISRRLGHSSYFDMAHVMTDFVTLGLLNRPWYNARLGPSGATFGYFDSHRFEPDSWQPGYQNPAFTRASERDKAWMARIIADITPEAIWQAVGQAHFSSPDTARELQRILLQRRRRILARYFAHLSPLTHPVVEGGTLCMRDLAISGGVAPAAGRLYYTRNWTLEGGEPVEREAGRLTRRRPDQVCVSLPDVDVSDGTAAYLIVDVAGMPSAHDMESMPARIHAYRLPDGAYRLVGLERPYDRDAPR